MWWNKPKAPPKSRREQLLEAQDKLQRQIEIAQISMPNTGRGAAAYSSVEVAKTELAELSTILAQIQDELANEPVDKDPQ